MLMVCPTRLERVTSALGGDVLLVLNASLVISLFLDGLLPSHAYLKE